ncbi:hypothetical protein D1641_04365 [Colidextribacter sp. OB.20]|uniref:hypothetical protein n=1 Tax=Colidextribacter sp. OB.20 TaxID=2304568 RepID=UPI00136F72BB|nr:hypothetical protein [Colidextribacter sp. OB.20]NBI09252.1 hypothetical protein [Colidextribacter sp. OB.20]
MKKLLALMLVAALALSLVACGGGGGTGDNNTPSGGNGDTTSTDTPSGGMTKEEMLEQAENSDLKELYEIISANKIKAEEELTGKIYCFNGYVDEIESDYIVLSYYGNTIVVYLPKDDIINLVKDQEIAVVGELGKVGYEDNSSWYISYGGCELINAYVAKDIYEITGKLTFRYLTLKEIDGSIVSQDGKEDAWYFGLTEPDATVETMIISLSDAISVNHVPGQSIDTITIDGTELKNGDNITISGRKTANSMIDVKLVSVN